MTLQKKDFFLFAVSSWSTYLSSFFIFPIYFQCRMTIEWPTLSSWETSCVAIRGSASVINSQLIVVSFRWSATMLLIFKALISFAKLLEPHCTVCSLAVPGPNVLICCALSPLFYDPFWTWIRKSLKFAFCLTSSL